jgi:superfamily II DNA or RNA helicase
MIALRYYQAGMVGAARAAFAQGHKRVLLVSPTGSGKTIVFCHIAMTAASKGKRTMILVHRQELVDQTCAALTAFGVDHGVIIAGAKYDASKLIQVASVQTLIRRLDKVQGCDLIVIDEAHHAVAGSWRQVIDRFDSSWVLGVTATPERLDGKGLKDVFTTLLRGPEVRDLVRDGFLSPPSYYAPTRVDLSAVKTIRGDFDARQLADCIDKPHIIGDAVEHYRKHADGQSAVAFCINIKHAENVAASFRSAGIASEVLDGTLSPEVRRDRVRALGCGEIKVLTSCEIINEGFDLPVVAVGILLRPTQSLGLHLQQIGRVLRPAEGKTRAIILDHAGNLERHGLAEDVREWSLEGKKKRIKETKEVIRTRQCPACFACHAWSPCCTECGHEYQVQEREIKVEEGVLVEVGNYKIRCICGDEHSKWEAVCPKCGMIHDLHRAKKREQGRHQSLNDLIALGKRRGYASPYGWAKKVFASRNNKQKHETKTR